MKRRIAGRAATALVSGAMSLTALGLGTGSAAAQAPTGTWCPGQPLPLSDAVFGWDMNVCHDYWFVNPGEGNVPITASGVQLASYVRIGSPPPGLANLTPPPPPPPPAPGSYCATNPIGCHFFGPYGPGYS